MKKFLLGLVLLTVFISFLSVNVVAKWIVEDNAKNETIINENLKWVEDDVQALNAMNTVFGTGYGNSELARVYYIYNITCNQKTQEISITFGDLWNPERIMRLDYTLADAGQTFNLCMGGNVQLNELEHFSSWNLPHFQYGEDNYTGYVNGWDKCYFVVDNVYQCYEGMTLDFVDGNVPSNNLRGNIVMGLYFDNITKTFNNYSYAMGWFIVEGEKPIISNIESRVSLLESWKSTVDSAITTIQNALINFGSRISALEGASNTNTTMTGEFVHAICSISYSTQFGFCPPKCPSGYTCSSSCVSDTTPPYCYNRTTHPEYFCSFNKACCETKRVNCTMPR